MSKRKAVSDDGPHLEERKQKIETPPFFLCDPAEFKKQLLSGHLAEVLSNFICGWMTCSAIPLFTMQAELLSFTCEDGCECKKARESEQFMTPLEGSAAGAIVWLEKFCQSTSGKECQENCEVPHRILIQPPSTKRAPNLSFRGMSSLKEINYYPKSSSPTQDEIKLWIEEIQHDLHHDLARWCQGIESCVDKKHRVCVEATVGLDKLQTKKFAWSPHEGTSQISMNLGDIPCRVLSSFRSSGLNSTWKFQWELLSF